MCSRAFFVLAVLAHAVAAAPGNQEFDGWSANDHAEHAYALSEGEGDGDEAQREAAVYRHFKRALFGDDLSSAESADELATAFANFGHWHAGSIIAHLLREKSFTRRITS